MPSSSSSLIKSLLLDGEWPESKLTLHLTIFLGLLFLGAFQHFVVRGDQRGQTVVRLGEGEEEEDGAEEEEVAVVQAIYVIKSCAGSSLDSVKLLKKGFELDRNWAIVRTDKHEVLSLRQEAKLTLIQPSIDEERGMLKISLSPQADRHDLKPFAVPLRPSQDELRQWELLPELPMWGDAADGRIVRMIAPSQQDGDVTPAEWLTEFLNYPAALVQFDTTPSSATRISHPIYRPPRPGYDVSSLEGPRGIHFADEYPLLVATTESLHALQDKIAEEIK
ncbi:hypothetical protein CF326_g10028, partial [Tilletia indica]